MDDESDLRADGEAGFCAACVAGDETLVRRMLRLEPTLVGSFGEVREDHREFMRKFGAEGGWSPLHLAGHYGHAGAGGRSRAGGGDVRVRRVRGRAGVRGGVGEDAVAARQRGRVRRRLGVLPRGAEVPPHVGGPLDEHRPDALRDPARRSTPTCTPSSAATPSTAGTPRGGTLSSLTSLRRTRSNLANSRLARLRRGKSTAP